MTPKKTSPSKRRMRTVPKRRRGEIRREEFNRLIDILNERGEILIRLVQEQHRLLQDQQIQFKRIAQLQAELDILKQARS